MIKLPNIKGLMTIGKSVVVAHRPELLFGASIVSTVSAVVTAGFAGYKSGQQVLQVELDVTDEELDDLRKQKLSQKEKIQLTWLNYLPSAGLTAGALGSTTGLHLVHVKEKKAMAAAALMAIDEVKEQSKAYIDDVMEAVDKNVDDKTMDVIEKDIVDPEREGKLLLQDTDHEVEELYLVRDNKTGRDIWSNERRIEEAVNHVNQFIAKHGDCDLNSFYANAGFETLPDGDDWGWSGDWVELKWDTTKRDDGRPVRRFTFRTKPAQGFDRPVS